MRKPDASWSFPWSLQPSTSPDSLKLTRHSLNQRAPEDTSYRPRESFLGSSGASYSSRNLRDGESSSKDYKRVSTNEKGSAGARFPKHNVSTWTALADAAAVMLPLGVLIFIILVWRLHGTRTEEETDRKWRNAITMLATIFPILFAAVVGRLMAEAARWRLEKGSSVGSLEQLMGSRTVGATLHTMIEFRTVNLLGFGLIFIWAFSPLGGQSILRMLSSRFIPEFSTTDLTYFDTGANNQLNTLPVASTASIVAIANAGVLGYLATVYASFVAQPDSIQVDTMDHWGNVKIPFLDQNAPNNWTEISHNSQQIQYSSLAGIPLQYSTVGNVTFAVESSYVHLDCNNITKFPISFPQDYMTNITSGFWANSHTYSDNILKAPNGTWRGVKNHVNNTQNLTTWAIALDRFVDPFWADQEVQNARLAEKLNTTDVQADVRDGLRLFMNETGIEAGEANLLLQIIIPSIKPTRTPETKLEAVCGVTQRYVESRVNCTYVPTSGRHTCAVVAQRPSQQPHAPEAISILSLPHLFYYISKEFPLAATGRPLGGFPDFSIQYLKDPTFKELSSSPDVSLDDLPDDKIGIRLNQLLNTYLMLSQQELQITSSTLGQTASFEPNITISSEVSNLVEVFQVSALWVGFCLVSCLILLACGILSVVFTHLAHGPEVLGYVSTLVRDSKFMDLLMNTSWMDGTELTKELRSQRIRYGYTHHTMGGEPLMGVGYQADTEQIKDFIARYQDR
ncbi:hypothetical protein CGCA056_v005299 [Colletotrichum aenigma]|uniref:uncharacterized protein n=1 Tax=Colletotrichum aenigma TaxID=1215731 RepID=UPI001872C07A|nr:uncharacterized protein CGCA056_v005299 [Colletotrichum aenigma]KAF5524290.1 hypothetical protein CGCA056_v005299 [Colletotrichum aenigma]